VYQILQLLDGLLLVFILSELLHTVRATVEEDVLMIEPFLIIGVVATIRRLIVIGAEAPNFIKRGSSTSSCSSSECSLPPSSPSGSRSACFAVARTRSRAPPQARSKQPVVTVLGGAHRLL
jgi:hypothetical protein